MQCAPPPPPLTVSVAAGHGCVGPAPWALPRQYPTAPTASDRFHCCVAKSSAVGLQGAMTRCGALMGAAGGRGNLITRKHRVDFGCRAHLDLIKIQHVLQHNVTYPWRAQVPLLHPLGAPFVTQRRC